MDPRARRLAAIWGIPFAVLFVIFAPPLVLIGRLPDPLAVHWGTDGAPNGSMPFWASLAFLGGFWLVAWIGLLVAGRHGAPSSPALAVTYYLGGILAAVQISIVDRNLNAEDWRRVLLYPRQQRSGQQAKQTADEIARRIIDWSGAPRPTALRHDTAEAILIGLWGVLEIGWLDNLPSEVR